MLIAWQMAGIVVTSLGSDLGFSSSDSNKLIIVGNLTREEEKEEVTVPPDHKDGGLPLISDSVFSFIIMVYVLLAFFFVFFLFCWKRGPERSPSTHKVCSNCLEHKVVCLQHTRCFLLTLTCDDDIYSQGSGSHCLLQREAAPPSAVVTPPTPTEENSTTAF